MTLVGNWSYQTAIKFGAGRITELPQACAQAGIKKPLLVTDRGLANLPITLYPDMKVGQMSFMNLDQPAERPYGSGALGSKYQGQVGPTPSAYWKNFS